MAQSITATTRLPVTTSLRAFHELTKPGITLFVGLTAVTGYALSAAVAEPLPVISVLLSTLLMSGGAATLNQVAERDLDRSMRRTAQRPLPANVLEVNTARIFGWTLSLAGALLAALTLPMLTLVCLAVCHVSYVFAYTPLKRTTPLCTLVGAIPGSVPVLAGAAAAGGLPNSAALALTALLFTWQIPHFFAIGWLARADYARADFRMLPVTDATGRTTARAALLYAIATQGFAILVTREMTAAPLVMAIVHTAGSAYVLAALLFYTDRTQQKARRLFFTSLIVLPVILGALMVGVAL